MLVIVLLPTCSCRRHLLPFSAAIELCFHNGFSMLLSAWGSCHGLWLALARTLQAWVTLRREVDPPFLAAAVRWLIAGARRERKTTAGGVVGLVVVLCVLHDCYISYLYRCWPHSTQEDEASRSVQKRCASFLCRIFLQLFYCRPSLPSLPSPPLPSPPLPFPSLPSPPFPSPPLPSPPEPEELYLASVCCLSYVVETVASSFPLKQAEVIRIHVHLHQSSG